jgi:uncharacterized protein (DUF488 family)
MKSQIYTIGHSTLELEAFADILKASDISLVIDVRTVPRSRANPQFNIDAVADGLMFWGIGYEHFPELGGLRGRSYEVGIATNGLWTNESFHNYADYAMSQAFRDGLERLRNRGKVESLVIMCAEAVWWRCHRRIIADHLILGGDPVYHIVGTRVQQATPTLGAIVSGNGSVRYPAPRPSRDIKIPPP